MEHEKEVINSPKAYAPPLALMYTITYTCFSVPGVQRWLPSFTNRGLHPALSVWPINLASVQVMNSRKWRLYSTMGKKIGPRLRGSLIVRVKKFTQPRDHLFFALPCNSSSPPEPAGPVEFQTRPAPPSAWSGTSADRTLSAKWPTEGLYLESVTSCLCCMPFLFAFLGLGGWDKNR